MFEASENIADIDESTSIRRTSIRLVSEKRFIVTVKLPKNPKHDPRHKVTGPCPMNPAVTCTDVTGEHHSELIYLGDIEQIRKMYSDHGFHVTRIEQI